MEVKALYDGKVRLALDKKHRYFRDNVRIPSVTQCIGIVDKPALRFWFVNMAIKHVEMNIEPGKMYDEVELGQILKDAKFAHRRITNEAADIGKVVHDWIEEYVKRRINGTKRKPRLPINEKAKDAVRAFIHWDEETEPDYLFSERKLYSEIMDVAGTVDIIADIGDTTYVIDIKTSKAVYPEYHMQTAAYAEMAKEEGITQGKVGRLIIHVPKDGSGFSVHAPDNTDGADLEAFKACRDLYRWKEGY